jgi:predicted O-methyltransferase YrrM
MSAAFKYLIYKLFACHKKGHGVHSPFVYDLIRNVFIDNIQYPAYIEIAKNYKKLLADDRVIETDDMGAGSKVLVSNERKVSEIARISVIKPKYGELLFRMVRYFQPQNIIEMGTSLGISGLYLSSGNENAIVFTLEGCNNTLNVAKEVFASAGKSNIVAIQGNFNNSLPELIKSLDTLDFVLFDGNHTYEATIEYFKLCLEKANNKSVFVFDDINWSEGMNKAWEEIIRNEKVTVSIDIYKYGIVFLNPDLSKENFVIRF